MLNFSEALHLVRIESSKADALELIAVLAERGQIAANTEIELQDMVEELF